MVRDLRSQLVGSFPSQTLSVGHRVSSAAADQYLSSLPVLLDGGDLNATEKEHRICGTAKLFSSSNSSCCQETRGMCDTAEKNLPAKWYYAMATPKGIVTEIYRDAEFTGQMFG